MALLCTCFAVKGNAQSLESVSIAPGRILSTTNDPVYYAEFPAAYSTAKISITLNVIKEGSYILRVKLNAAGDLGNGTRFEFERRLMLPAGKHTEILEVSVKELTDQRGLLWSFIPDKPSEMVVSLSSFRSQRELLESEEYRRGVAQLNLPPGKESEEIIAGLAPPEKGSEWPVETKSFPVWLSPVERKVARDPRQKNFGERH